VILAGASPADLNMDSMVDFNDLLILADEWLQSGDNLLADIYPADGDGLVNLSDMAEFAKFWRHTQMPIPEDMVLIPGGQFLMGDHYSGVYRSGRPVHPVKIDSFRMGKYEVTNQQYCDYLNSAIAQGLIEVSSGIVYAPGHSEPYSNTTIASQYSQIRYDNGVFLPRIRDGYNMAQHPVAEVSWYGAAAYCNWRSQQEGHEQCYDLPSGDCDFDKQGYRLPTEAEWEYAARGGCYMPYYEFPWYDNSMDCSKANVRQTVEYYCNPLDLSSRPYTSPVGYYQANPYGLYDMAGGVWELCNDWYSSTYYSISPYDNPKGPDSTTTRIHRGGGWHCTPHGCRVAHRDHCSLILRDKNGGFRVVLDLH
jgi:formylglycine-generating enzyme required for sulfatase activity